MQVKTHAQCMMRKLDDGQDIFEGLDEYLENPEAFGKPPADDPVWDASTRYEEVVDDVKKTSPKPQSVRKKKHWPSSVVRTNWVDLSHKVRASLTEFVDLARNSSLVSTHFILHMLAHCISLGSRQRLSRVRSKV